mgnify:CR=1 FL=1
MSIRIRPLAAPAVLTTVMLFAISSSWGQPRPEDLLNRAKAEQSVLTQRIEGKMRDALAEAGGNPALLNPAQVGHLPARRSSDSSRVPHGMDGSIDHADPGNRERQAPA